MEIGPLNIEKPRGLGEVEEPRLGDLRIGECAARVAEQLVLDQMRGDRGAVDFDERSVVARATAMERVRDELRCRSRRG